MLNRHLLRLATVLSLCTLIAACEGGRATGPTGFADRDSAAPPEAACAATDAVCQLTAADINPADFIAAVQNCSPDESGINCLFNAAFDHLGGAELAQVVNLLTDACLNATLGACSTVNDSLPDSIVALSLPLSRGQLLRSPLANQSPSRKLVDGRIDDWIGDPSRIGGSARWSAGEHIYTDYVYDNYGADDGDDARRLALLGPIIEVQSRVRRVDQLMQAVGDQLGVPKPLGALDHYGDGPRDDASDLTEVRVAAQGERLHLLLRSSQWLATEAGRYVILIDRDPTPHEQLTVLPFGVATERYDLAIALTASEAHTLDLRSGQSLNLAPQVAADTTGFVNAVELALDLPPLLDPENQLNLLVLSLDSAGQVANLAYRYAEPVAGIYNEQQQAIALFQGNVDAFGETLSRDDLVQGRSEAVAPGPGYHERRFDSGANIAVENGELARAQRYGLFVPSQYDASQATPIDYWLHYRGGKAHSGGAWTPRLINTLGEIPGHIVATPHGRGTSSWYTTDAHQDFFEVMADVEALFNIDPRRRYLSGYSMGGYGTYLFGLLYPELFAAGYSTSGAPTQGGWTGLGPDLAQCTAAPQEIPEVGAANPCFIEANDGDANAQLNFRILENARHFPLSIHHGSNDELVPSPGIERFGIRLLELGYRYDLLTFPGYEHFSQAAVDEWAEGARFMHRFVSPQNPRQVTYKVVPALVDALNTIKPDPAEAQFAFAPDGAYWVDGMQVAGFDPVSPRDTSVSGMVEAESLALPGDLILPLPSAGIPLEIGNISLGTPVLAPGHSTPFIRHGQEWLALNPAGLSNGFAITTTGLSALSLDTARMNLDLAATATGTVLSDQPLQLRLRQLQRPVTIRVDGGVVARNVRDSAVLSLPAGESTVELSPP